jgi:prepilin-type N-terminal cleavage/methylation domain-containing protein
MQAMKHGTAMTRHAGSHGYRVTSRAGFSMIELVIVLVIAAVVMTMGAQKFRKFETTQQIDNARNAALLMGRRARASAIERGTTMQLVFDPTLKRARITVGGATVEEVYFEQEYAVTMTNSNSDVITVCYNSRGFALTSSCSTGGLPATIEFARNGQAQSIQVQPLGQILKI